MLIKDNEIGSFPDINQAVELYTTQPNNITDETETCVKLVNEEFNIKQGEYYLIKIKPIWYAQITAKRGQPKSYTYLTRNNPLLASAFPTKADAERAAKIMGVEDYKLVQVKEIMEPHILAFILGYELIIDYTWDDGTKDFSSEAIYTKYPTLCFGVGDDLADLNHIDMFKVNDEKAYNEYLEFAKQLKIDLINKIYNKLLDVHSIDLNRKIV